MSLLDFTRRVSRRTVEPVANAAHAQHMAAADERISKRYHGDDLPAADPRISKAAHGRDLPTSWGAAVKDMAATVANFIRKDWKMSVSQIDEKLVEARAAVAAAEKAHAAAAIEYHNGTTEDDKAVSRCRKALVAAQEKVEDLLAARLYAANEAADEAADAAAKAEAARIESIENAVDELHPMAQKVEECLDALAVALADLRAGVDALALDDRRPAHVAVTDALGHLPTLVYHKLGKLGVVPQGANLMTYASELGLVKRLPDPKVMAAMCPPKAPMAPGKKAHGGSYFVPA